MIITNSLGANYTAGDRLLALKLLFQPWKWQNGPEIKLLENGIATSLNDLGTRNDVSVHLYYKGRHAIYEALRRLGIGTGDEVIIQAFTCVAVVQPVLDLGATPIYVDVDSKNLNPSFNQIKKAVTSKTKGIILQHTLGYINRENDKIVQWCRNHKIFVIQDLAHALGAAGLKRCNPASAGLHLNILSFSQDKIIDGVSGGALIAPDGAQVKNLKFPARSGYATGVAGGKIQSRQTIIKQLLYPWITYWIRKTYSFKLGKIIHFCAKNLDLLPSPLDAPSTPAQLPNALATIALNQLNRLEQIIDHRRKIALIYDRIIDKKFKLINFVDIKNGSCLRYPLWVEDRDKLENKLTKYGFYLMDHWYDAPVSPKWVNNPEVKYRSGSCPNAENLSKHIFNLPTHISISEEKAERLAECVNTLIR